LLSRRITDAERKIFAPYLESAELLGVRTAELHLSLCGEASDPIFQPEPLEACDQKVLASTISTQADLSLQLFLKRIGYLEKEVLHFKNRLIDSERLLQNRIHNYSKVFSKSKKIRCHGDLHLGQILVSGQDFVIIDFEGEPKKPIEERRRKQSPLRDVAGMIRSLNYALFTAFRIRSRDSGAGECKALENMAKAWNFWISSSYLQAYLSTARKGTFLPSDEQELSTLLEMFLLERAFYELEYELNNRPEWVPIPIQGILELTGV
jgi:maltose alpha-D-glucosyltransferase/alpha-amylase